MTNIFITIKDETGVLRPSKMLYRDDQNLKYYQPDIDKFMKKGRTEGLKLVRVEIVEIEELS